MLTSVRAFPVSSKSITHLGMPATTYKTALTQCKPHSFTTPLHSPNLAHLTCPTSNQRLVALSAVPGKGEMCEKGRDKPKWLQVELSQGLMCEEYESLSEFIQSSPSSGKISLFMTPQEILIKQKDGQLLQQSVAELNQKTLDEVILQQDQQTQTLLQQNQVSILFEEDKLQTGFQWSKTPVTFDWQDGNVLRVKSPTISIPAWLGFGDARKNARLISVATAVEMMKTLVAEIQLSYSNQLSDSGSLATPVEKTTQKLAGLETDIYAPLTGDHCPAVVFLQGAGVPKSAYSEFARRFTQRGYVVLVPEHAPFFAGKNWTCASLAQPDSIERVWQDVKNGFIPLELLQKIDLKQLYAMGHSYGGIQLVTALSNKNPKPLGTHKAQLPEATQGVILFGANNKIGPLPSMTLHADDTPLFIIQGDQDTITRREDTVKMVANADAAKLQAVFLNNVNHYGVTNSDGDSALRSDVFARKPLAKAAVLEKMIDEIEAFMSAGTCAFSDPFDENPVDISLTMNRTRLN